LRVDIANVSLQFSPLTLRPLEVPFVLERGQERFTGAIWLSAGTDPLPCRWQQSSDVSTLAMAWALALTAYAELTCVSPRFATPRPPNSTSSRRSLRSRVGTSRSFPSRSESAASGLPAGFRPRGDTARFLASYVAGHRRRLQPGQHHSAEAAANATAVGITLRPGETWVQPHVRGVPADAILHFAWSGPSWAATALHGASMR
jgi:hypothetical protein